MDFDSLKAEQEFDRYAAEFLLKKRNPAPADMAKVMVRTYDNLAGGLPSISAFERAWLELYEEGTIPLVTDKLTAPAVAPAETLTAEQYRSIPASQIARDYLNNKGGWFRAAVDRLIARKEI